MSTIQKSKGKSDDRQKALQMSSPFVVCVSLLLLPRISLSIAIDAPATPALTDKERSACFAHTENGVKRDIVVYVNLSESDCANWWSDRVVDICKMVSRNST